jgi:hypothetical protein
MDRGLFLPAQKPDLRKLGAVLASRWIKGTVENEQRDKCEDEFGSGN